MTRREEKIRSIRLELVRSGEDENQLLSPLTPYLALVQNRPAEELRLPFQHGEFLELHRQLRYEEGPERAAQAAQKMAQLLARFLGGLKGLHQELASSGADLFELQLVLSASELALLPFELLTGSGAMPAGASPFPGRTLILRQSRRQAAPFRSWPDCPRILLVASSAGGVVPAKSHLRALQAAAELFLPYRTDLPGMTARQWLGDHVEVLAEASLHELQRRCREGSYTHVHLLAHGGEEGPPWGRRFGLWMASTEGKGRQLVSGQLLADALRTGGGLPSVVTLASCDSGNQGSVLYPGGSVAQELHQAGVPLVVASQLPLTFAGSAVFTEEFYRKILRGEDPREAVLKTRSALLSLGPTGWLDWASLVVYADLSASFGPQVRRAQRRVFQRRIDARLAWLGHGIAGRGDRSSLELETEEQARSFEGKLRQLMDELQEGCEGRARVEALAFCGSAEKRWAEALQGGVAGASHWRQRLRVEALRRSRGLYFEAFRSGGPEVLYALVQALVVDRWLREQGDSGAEELQDGGAHARWLLDLTPGPARGAEWHRASLELELLSADQPPRARWLLGAPGAAWECYSLLRQLRQRYLVFVKGEALRERVETLARELEAQGVTGTWSSGAMWKR
jgi:hypothetical protein